MQLDSCGSQVDSSSVDEIVSVHKVKVVKKKRDNHSTSSSVLSLFVYIAPSSVITTNVARVLAKSRPVGQFRR